jgi:Cof subfamily protein (haloacid dehalogenase superfamily)
MSTDPALARIRLLAIDIDGTLLTGDHRVLPSVRRAFADARAAGLTLVLASARSPGALRHILADLNHAGPCICFSGAWTGTIDPSSATSTVEGSVTIPLSAALAIAGAAIAVGLVPSWHTERRWTVSRIGPSVEREMHVTRQTPEVSEDFAAAGAPCKILLIGPRNVLLGLRTSLAEDHGGEFEAVFSHATYLEVLPKGVDKARAVFSLAERRGIARDGVAAVGDAENDLGMIRAAGYGVAMANATEEVRQAARWVTASNEEAGVAVLIDRILATCRR